MSHFGGLLGEAPVMIPAPYSREVPRESLFGIN